MPIGSKSPRLTWGGGYGRGHIPFRLFHGYRKSPETGEKAGARTIVITSPKEPLLAKYADVCLSTGGQELSIYGTAIFSRIPDLAVVDLLYMGIIQSDYERFSRNLDKSGAVIADRGYERE